MGFLGGGPSSGDDRGIYLYVQVAKSGEKIRVRIDPSSDLAQHFDADGGDNPTPYTCSRAGIGREAVEPGEAARGSDGRRRLTGQEITGGKFITEADFFADQAGAGDDDGGD